MAAASRTRTSNPASRRRSPDRADSKVVKVARPVVARKFSIFVWQILFAQPRFGGVFFDERCRRYFIRGAKEKARRENGLFHLESYSFVSPQCRGILAE